MESEDAASAPHQSALRKHASAESVERGHARRAQIIEAATQLFAQTGYRGTGLAGIAAKVGVTQAALLHHFGSKERLLRAVVQHRSEQDGLLIACIIGGSGIGMFDRLELLGEHNLEHRGVSRLFTVLVAENFLSDDPIHEFFVDRYRALREAITAAMATGQQRGEIRRDVDLDVMSYRIVAALDGLQIQWLLDPESVDLVDACRSLGASFRRELETPTS